MDRQNERFQDSVLRALGNYEGLPPFVPPLPCELLAGELDHSQGVALIDQLLEFDEPYPALLMTGGDPLMRADFFNLVQRAKSRGSTSQSRRVSHRGSTKGWFPG
jgi:hypothetical protein